MTTHDETPPQSKDSSPSSLGAGFDRARPVLFAEDTYFLKADRKSGDVWILHDVPVDLDLKEALYDAGQNRLAVVTQNNEVFDTGIPISDEFPPYLKKAERLTMIYLLKGKDEIGNMIFLPLRVI